jgi:GNAT superfamily N-acetyltransferase
VSWISVFFPITVTGQCCGAVVVCNSLLAVICGKRGIELSTSISPKNMCQETPPTKSSSACSDDDGIIIRRYQSSDQEQVKHIFRTGMESNIFAAYTAVVRHPIAALPLTCLTAITAGVTHHICNMTSVLGRNDNNKQQSSPVLVVVVAAVAVLPATGLYYLLKSKFGMYIQASLDDDLSKIEEVYSGKGCFLVAVDTAKQSAGAIVGIVGGHDRERGTGLGQRLIRRLEEECQPVKMHLTCSSIQYAAHRLYSRAGFLLKERFKPAGLSWWLRNCIEIYPYEKELTIS